jgi:Ca2+-binding RTX toxin-like protein
VRIRFILGLAALAVSCGVPAVLPIAAPAAASTGNGVIAYSYVSGDIFSFDPGTGVTRNLTADVSAPIRGLPPLLWSPNGRRLLYAGPLQRPDNAFQVTPSVMNADGTEKYAVVTDLSRQWLAMCWMSDDVIVVEGFVESPIAADYFAVNADGTGLRPLTTGGTEGPSRGTCSPTSGRFFFTNHNDMTHSFVSLDGSPPKRLPFTGGSILPSPDGLKLAFANADGLFVGSIDGTELARVVDSTTVIASGFAWSPDSTRIAFADTAGTRVISIESAQQQTLSPLALAPLRWSPDGTRILFGANGIMNEDGSCESSVVASASELAWQPVPGGAPSTRMDCVDLGVAANFKPTDLMHGEIFTYSVSVTNGGNEAEADVRVGLTFISNGKIVSLVASQGSCNAAAASCRLGRLEADGSATATFKMRAEYRGPLQHDWMKASLRVSGSGPDINEANNSQSMTLARVYACSALGTSGPDFLRGTPADDSYCALAGPDRLLGKGGNDSLWGGPGTDSINGGIGHDRIFGGGENDTILARDTKIDIVDCGGGRDLAVVDRVDRVAGNCENVRRGRR